MFLVDIKKRESNANIVINGDKIKTWEKALLLYRDNLHSSLN